MHRQFLLFFSATLLLTLTNTAAAQVGEAPYKARVIQDDVYVRCGPSDRAEHYPTQRLRKDDIVTVLRHDPGGWYLIKPPEGSFSWVAEEYVRRTAGNEGEVIENNIVAWVGSNFGDEASIWQRKLQSGDRVTILGQKLIDAPGGARPMLKIASPDKEYRWISGAAVVPMTDNVRQKHDRDPFQIPSNARQPTSAQQPTANGDSSVSDDAAAAAVSPSPQLARLQQIRKQQQQLREIDDRFRSMLLGDPAGWDLEEVESSYRSLQDNATHKPLAGQIDLRYPAIERYRQRKAEYTDFKRLTSQTEQRDAQLLASQYGLNSGTAFANNGDQPLAALPGERVALADESSVSLGPILNRVPTDEPPAPTLQPFPDDNFMQLAPDQSLAGPAADSQFPALNIPPSSRYIGAGILQRSASSEPDAPAYVLATPSGRVLAHVAPKGDVDLENHVGQSVGLYGSRMYRSDIKSDFIEVSGLEEVKIRR